MNERVVSSKAAKPTNGGGGEGADIPVPDMPRAMSAMIDGWTDIGGQMFEYTQTSFDASLAAAEALRRCQTPQDCIRVQMGFARDSMERTLDGVSRLSGVMARMSRDAADAITPRQG